MSDTTTARKIRTRKNSANGTWDVQSQDYPMGSWHSIGSVRLVALPPKAPYSSAKPGIYTYWEASRNGHRIGNWRTKRDAVAAVSGASS